jgi:uncharacterized protein (DUF433 family)
MQIEEYFDFLDGGDIRIKGHRVGIEDILYEYLCNDQNPEELTVRFPTLSKEQIYAAVLYYLSNKQELTQYMNDWTEHGNRMRELQEQNLPPVVLRLRKIAAERHKKLSGAKYE